MHLLRMIIAVIDSHRDEIQRAAVGQELIPQRRPAGHLLPKVATAFQPTNKAPNRSLHSNRLCHWESGQSCI
jgi:hypothetical protein